MASFFKRGVTNDVSESRFAPDSVSQRDSQTHNDVKRDLIRAVLKNTLHRLGIPHDWLACEVIIIGHEPKHEKLYIQLMLMKWHETFMRYAPALEQQLLRGLVRIDPTVDATKYIFSWRFSTDCGCPFGVMPPPTVWAHDEDPVDAVKVAPSLLERRG